MSVSTDSSFNISIPLTNSKFYRNRSILVTIFEHRDFYNKWINKWRQ